MPVLPDHLLQPRPEPHGRLGSAPARWRCTRSPRPCVLPERRDTRWPSPATRHTKRLRRWTGSSQECIRIPAPAFFDSSHCRRHLGQLLLARPVSFFITARCRLGVRSRFPCAISSPSISVMNCGRAEPFAVATDWAAYLSSTPMPLDSLTARQLPPKILQTNPSGCDRDFGSYGRRESSLVTELVTIREYYARIPFTLNTLSVPHTLTMDPTSCHQSCH
jgi:hypothetical protein